MKFISSTNDIRKYLGLKPEKNIKFKNISIDTRTIKKDSLFIALKWENFNGNKFIEKAFSSGAIAVLCSDKSYIHNPNLGLFCNKFSLDTVSNNYIKVFSNLKHK